MIGDIPVGAFVMFGLIIAIILLINLEVLKVSRQTRSELYIAVKHIAEELQSLRTAHDEHVSSSDSPPVAAVLNTTARPQRRRSTDVADWVVSSDIGVKR